MAKKKVKVKSKVPSAKMLGSQPVPRALVGIAGTTGAQGSNVLSANDASMDGQPFMGANLGLSQQMDALEQAQTVDQLRIMKKRKVSVKKKKY